MTGVSGWFKTFGSTLLTIILALLVFSIIAYFTVKSMIGKDNIIVDSLNKSLTPQLNNLSESLSDRISDRLSERLVEKSSRIYENSVGPAVQDFKDDIPRLAGESARSSIRSVVDELGLRKLNVKNLISYF